MAGLPILDAEGFIKERVEQYQGWYNNKAVSTTRKYLTMRGFSVVAGSVVPVLVNVNWNQTILGVPVVTGAVTLLSLLVVIVVSLEGVLHYREQWKNYRSTEQLLGHETIAFRAGIAPYTDQKPEEALKLFVSRIEDAIRSENAATLNVMTMANEPSESKRGG